VRGSNTWVPYNSSWPFLYDPLSFFKSHGSSVAISGSNLTISGSACTNFINSVYHVFKDKGTFCHNNS